jgi:hypothetical protein
MGLLFSVSTAKVTSWPGAKTLTGTTKGVRVQVGPHQDVEPTYVPLIQTLVVSSPEIQICAEVGVHWACAYRGDERKRNSVPRRKIIGKDCPVPL